MKNDLTARRLTEALNDAGIIPQELATRSGVSKSSISQYINGSHAPSNISSGKMAKILGVDPMWLMGFDVPKTKDNGQDQKKVFAQQLHKYLAKADKNPAELKKHLQISDELYSRWSTAKEMPSPGQLEMIAGYLHVEIADLLQERIYIAKLTDVYKDATEAEVEFIDKYFSLDMSTRERALPALSTVLSLSLPPELTNNDLKFSKAAADAMSKLNSKQKKEEAG